MRKTDDGFEYNSEEINAIFWLYGLEQQVRIKAALLEPAIKENGVWKEYRLAKTWLEKALNPILENMSIDQLTRMRNAARSSEMTMTARRAKIANDDHLRAIMESDIDVLVSYAHRAECEMCLKNAKEAKRCPLRKILIGIAAPKEHNPYRCEYADME